MRPKRLRYKLYCFFLIIFISCFILSVSWYWGRRSKSMPDIVMVENTPPEIVPTIAPIPTPTDNLSTILFVETLATVAPLASPTPLSIITHTKTKLPLTVPPTATHYPTPPPLLVNDLAPDAFIYLPDTAIHHCKEIFARGQVFERDPNRFSKIGDSIVDTEQFFTVFDNGNYHLGDHQYLEDVIIHYSGAYARFGVALRDGLNSSSVLDPMWANKDLCNANETPLACEIRLNNPSLLLIHFGTNDWTETYEKNMRQIIEISIQEGIVPVLVTKANRIDMNNRRNEILRHLASEYHIPLWDFDVIAETLPDRGLAQDDAHLSIANDFDYSDTTKIVQGYKAFNLTGLMLLDAFMRQVVFSTP